MKSQYLFVLVPLFAMVALSSAADPHPPPPPPEPKPPTPEQMKLAETYFNFSASVGQIITETLINESITTENESKTKTPPPPQENGPLVTSILGIVHILSIMSLKPFSSPIAIPTFEKLLNATPKKLADAYELLMGTLDKNEADVVLTSHLYTSEEVKADQLLTKLKVEIVKSDLKDAAKINKQLKEKLASPLEENYIPEGSNISPAATSLMIDTLHITESWPVPMTKASKAKFAGEGEEMEMIELKGMFGLVEGPLGTEVHIPFQNPKRYISLGLANPIPLAAEAGRASEPPPPPTFINGTMIRIQLPVFKMTLREPGFSGSAKCDFKKEEKFLQFLDDLTFISFEPSKFEAVAISGAQVNNVAEFKKANGDNDKKGKALGEETSGSNKLPADAGAEARKEDGGDEKEKLIVFNRPFTFSIIDINVGSLLGGSIDSLKQPTAATKPSPVFGMDKPLPYLSCL